MSQKQLTYLVPLKPQKQIEMGKNMPSLMQLCVFGLTFPVNTWSSGYLSHKDIFPLRHNKSFCKAGLETKCVSWPLRCESILEDEVTLNHFMRIWKVPQKRREQSGTKIYMYIASGSFIVQMWGHNRRIERMNSSFRQMNNSNTAEQNRRHWWANPT